MSNIMKMTTESSVLLILHHRAKLSDPRMGVNETQEKQSKCRSSRPLLRVPRFQKEAHLERAEVRARKSTPTTQLQCLIKSAQRQQMIYAGGHCWAQKKHINYAAPIKLALVNTAILIQRKLGGLFTLPFLNTGQRLVWLWGTNRGQCRVQPVPVRNPHSIKSSWNAFRQKGELLPGRIRLNYFI